MQQRQTKPIFDLFCGIIFMSGVFVFVFHNIIIASLFFYWGIMQQRPDQRSRLTFVEKCANVNL
jgi:hypothetical protein